MTGHEMWMGGASEAIYSVLMMQNDFLAPNLNFEEPDEFTSLIQIVKKTRQAKIERLLSNSFGFGGTNSSLIIEKFRK
jgi:3-oxoacyl-[acyl-carrier-protein] synthase-1